MIGISSPGKLVLAEKLANFELDKLEQLGICRIDLIHKNDDTRHTDLAREQDVLAGLRHRAVGCGNDEDSAVHLRGAGDHVLHIIGVARAVNVRVVTRSPFRTRRAR